MKSRHVLLATAILACLAWTYPRGELHAQSATQPSTGAAGTPAFQEWSLSFPPEGSAGALAEPAEDFNFSGPFTLEAWLYPDSTAGDWSYIFSKNDGATGYSLRVKKGKYIFAWGKPSVVSKSDVAPEQWVHVCAVADPPRRALLYLNGKLEAEAEMPNPPQPNPRPLIVGSSPFGAKVAWKGRMVRVRVWSRALTEGEVADAAAGAPIKNLAGLNLSWPMSEGAGDSLRDQSNSGHDGRIRGASWVMANASAPAPAPKAENAAVPAPKAENAAVPAPPRAPAESILARNVLVVAAHGDVDEDVMVPAFRNAIRQAMGIPGVTKILVDLDTPGGLVAAADDIVKVIGNAPEKLEFYAYVSGDEYRGAFSAGAIIALSCRHIAMKPGTSTGAAMVVKSDDDGLTEKAAPKYQAAWAAQARALAEKNGHPPAVAEAMILTNMVLYAAPAGQGFRFFDEKAYASLSREEKAVAKVVKPSDKILALTADECAHYGLATLADPDAVPSLLGITDELEKNRFMDRWRSAVKSAELARRKFDGAREKFAQAFKAAAEQEVAVAVRLHPENPIADLGAEYFRSTARMFDDLAARCRAVVAAGGSYASFAEVVKIADAEAKRAALASRRIKALVSKELSPNDAQKLFVDLGMQFVTPVFRKE